MNATKTTDDRPAPAPAKKVRTTYVVVMERLGAMCYGTGEMIFGYEYRTRTAAQLSAARFHRNLYNIQRVMTLKQAEAMGARKSSAAIV